MTDYTEIKECIACGSKNLHPLVDLGMQPLANSFLKSPNEPDPKFPLSTSYCRDCYHVQLNQKVEPKLMFDNYLYHSGNSKTQLEYFDWFAKYAVEDRTGLNVLDIGCNDGSQLNAFKKLGCQTFGVDPAKNLYPISSKNHKVHLGYFDNNYPYVSADIIICQNAFAHNYDQLQLLKNMKRAIRPYGKIYITTSQADMIENGEFDTIYHEHLSYFNIRSMNELCKRAGLHIVEVLKHPIHGNSFIFTLSPLQKREAYVNFLIEQESKGYLYDESTYFWYKSRVESSIRKFRRLIAELKLDYKVIGYGASAKGNVLLNASGIKLDFIIDDSVMKRGLYTPGTHAPIVSIDALNDYENQDLVIIPLAWNLYDEIKRKVKERRPHRQDKFVTVFPYAQVEEEYDN